MNPWRHTHTISVTDVVAYGNPHPYALMEFEGGFYTPEEWDAMDGPSWVRAEDGGIVPRFSLPNRAEWDVEETGSELFPKARWISRNRAHQAPDKP